MSIPQRALEDAKIMEDHYNDHCSVEALVQQQIESKCLPSIIDLVHDSQGTDFNRRNRFDFVIESIPSNERRRRSLRRRATYESDEGDSITLFEYPMGTDAKVRAQRSFAGIMNNSTQDVITMSVGDSKRLEECEYLNDNIIDFRIKHHLLEVLNSPSHIYAFSCQFYSRLIQGKTSAQGYSLVSSWTKSFDLFSKKFIFVPVNLNAHWSLSIIVRPDLIASQVINFISSV